LLEHTRENEKGLNIRQKRGVIRIKDQKKATDIFVKDFCKMEGYNRIKIGVIL
jgi:hypothetical protein